MRSEARTTLEWNFVRQQGFPNASREGSSGLFRALMWQPRAIGSLFWIGMLLQAWPYFLDLGALLLWSAAWPRRNPFDNLYWHLQARPRGLPALGPARSPRRFAQALAGAFMLAIGFCLLAGWRTAAWVIEALFVGAQGALMFSGLCVGSYLFFLVTGQVEFANQTLPWSRAEPDPRQRDSQTRPPHYAGGALHVGIVAEGVPADVKAATAAASNTSSQRWVR